jgi:hypothetical protein
MPLTRTIAILSVLLSPLCHANSAVLPFVQESEKLQGALGHVDLAKILPLPGQFGRIVAIGNGKYAVTLKAGPDETKIPIKDLPRPLPESPSDIIITQAGDEVIRLEFEPKCMPFRFVVSNVAANSSQAESSFAPVLERGCILKLKSDSAIVRIMDPSNKRITNIVEYRFGPNATVMWDKVRRKPLWYGFTVRVRPSKAGN